MVFPILKVTSIFDYPIIVPILIPIPILIILILIPILIIPILILIPILIAIAIAIVILSLHLIFIQSITVISLIQSTTIELIIIWLYWSLV